MVYDKTNIKEQMTFILNELSKSIDALYTASNLLTINKILENMRIDINNLVYLNEVRDKYTIYRADTAKKPAGFDPFLTQFHEPWPEEKVSGNLTREAETDQATETGSPQAKEPDQEQAMETGAEAGEMQAVKMVEEAGKGEYSAQESERGYEEVKKEDKDKHRDGEKLSELDWLVSQLIDDEEQG